MEFIKTAENLKYVSSHVTLYVNPLQEACQFQDAAEEQRVERNLPSYRCICACAETKYNRKQSRKAFQHSCPVAAEYVNSQKVSDEDKQPAPYRLSSECSQGVPLTMTLQTLLTTHGWCSSSHFYSACTHFKDTHH